MTFHLVTFFCSSVVIDKTADLLFLHELVGGRRVDLRPLGRLA